MEKTFMFTETNEVSRFGDSERFMETLKSNFTGFMDSLKNENNTNINLIPLTEEDSERIRSEQFWSDDELNIVTEKYKELIKKETGWPDVIIDRIDSVEKYKVYKYVEEKIKKDYPENKGYKVETMVYLNADHIDFDISKAGKYVTTGKLSGIFIQKELTPLTKEDKERIINETGWSDSVINQMGSNEKCELCKEVQDGLRQKYPESEGYKIDVIPMICELENKEQDRVICFSITKGKKNVDTIFVRSEPFPQS